MLFKFIHYFILLLFITIANIVSGQSLKVSVPSSPPLIFMKEGAPAGLFTDVLSEVAKDQSWNLRYESVRFDQGLNQLRSASIDILPNIAITPEREEYSRFNTISLFTTWGQIFTKDENIETFPDLEGLKIGYLDNDYFVTNKESGFIKQVEEYNINVDLIPFNSYDEITNYLKDDMLDAGVFNRTYGFSKFIISKWDLFEEVHAAPIIFAPTNLYYAFPKDEKYDPIIKAIDNAILSYRKDKTSVYYTSIRNNLLTEPKKYIPGWIWLVIVTLGMGTSLFFVFNRMLSVKVSRRTLQVQKTKQHLENSNKKLSLALNAVREGIWEWEIQNDIIGIDEHSYNVLGYSRSGSNTSFQDLLEIIYPEDRAKWKKSFDVHFSDNSEFHEVEFRAYNSEKELRWYEIHGHVTEGDAEGKPLKYLGTFRDITHRKETERERELLIDALTGRNNALNCLFELSQLINDPAKSDHDVIRDTTSLINNILKYKKYAVTRITYLSKEFKSENYKEPVIKLEVPIEMNENIVGSIEVGYIVKETEDGIEINISDDARQFLESIAGQLNIMTANHDLEEKLEGSESKEREKISKELHDGVQQTLSAAVLNLNFVLDTLKKETGKSNILTKMNAGIENVNNSIGDIRNLAHELDINFVPAVDKLVHNLSEVSNIELNFMTNLKEERLSTKLEKTLFRIVQEALNNILKHANATKATIQLMKYPDMVILTIEDDGNGFDTQLVRSKFGLNSIKSRTSLVNGTSSIDSKQGAGTTITVEIPL